jgi:hypothetical protein
VGTTYQPTVVNLPIGKIWSTIRKDYDIMRAILKGERDAWKRAAYRDGRCKNNAQEIAASLHGHYREEFLFALHQDDIKWYCRAGRSKTHSKRR